MLTNVFNSYAKVSELLLFNDPIARSSCCPLKYVLKLQLCLSSITQHSTCLCQIPRPLFLFSQHHPSEQMDLPLGAISQVQYPSQWTPAILNLTSHHRVLKVFNILPAFWLPLWGLLQMAYKHAGNSQQPCTVPSQLFNLYNSVFQTEVFDSYRRK